MDLGTLWNGVFEILWIIAQLIWWVGVVVGAAILAFVIVYSLIVGSRKALKKPTPFTIYKRAEMRAILAFKDDQNAEQRVDDFLGGVRFAQQKHKP